MSKARISQNEALMIEVLRANGLTGEELIAQVRQGDVAAIQQIGGDDFDFSNLVQFAQNDWERFEQAVAEGYEITFNTINGIKYLLKVKFNQIVDQDYENKGTYLDGIKLPAEDVAWLRSVLYKYWAVVERGEEPETNRKVVQLTMVAPE